MQTGSMGSAGALPSPWVARRLSGRAQPDGGKEYFGYSANVAGLTSHANQFTDSPADELLTLTDGRGLTKTWAHLFGGRVMRKYDQNNALVLQHDYVGGLPKYRWSRAKGDTCYNFDAAGNLTNINDAGTVSDVSLPYDALNRVTNMTDGVGTTTGTGWPGGRLPARDGHNSGTGAWSTHSFHHADGNGNVTMLVDASQTAVATCRYDPFGRTTCAGGPLASANTMRFSSKLLHATSGLYYYGYRWYAPTMQQWISRDPIGEEGGLNLYSFVLNSPINVTDNADLFGDDYFCYKDSPPEGWKEFWKNFERERCNPKERCENEGGKWTQFNGYDSWKDCMNRNWHKPEDDPGYGPPVGHPGSPGGSMPWTWLFWWLRSKICNHPGCSNSPGHYFPGS